MLSPKSLACGRCVKGPAMRCARRACGRPPADGQYQIGQARAQRIQYRRRLRQMTETMGGNIDKKMEWHGG